MKVIYLLLVLFVSAFSDTLNVLTPQKIYTDNMPQYLYYCPQVQCTNCDAEPLSIGIYSSSGKPVTIITTGDCSIQCLQNLDSMQYVTDSMNYESPYNCYFYNNPSDGTQCIIELSVTGDSLHAPATLIDTIPVICTLDSLPPGAVKLNSTQSFSKLFDPKGSMIWSGIWNQSSSINNILSLKSGFYYLKNTNETTQLVKP